MPKERPRPRSAFVQFARLSVLSAGCAMTLSPAFAYRPFEGTDADVAKPGTIEIEMQPAGVLLEGSQRSLVAPATVLNIGLVPGWEAVFEGRVLSPLAPSEDASGPSLVGASALLKGVLRPGSLQDKPGPSVATEFGVLLPGVNAEAGFGASIAGIVSQRWEWGTVHFNAATALTREHHADLFVSTIVEGPYSWTVRPVAEVFFEEEFGHARTISGLLGAIWRVRDDLSFDVGIRHAVTNRHPVNELKLGMTFGFQLRPLRPSARN
jgi:hypothetical protein